MENNDTRQSAGDSWLRLVYWVLALLLIWGSVSLLGNALTPYIAGAVIAYMLSPLVNWLEARGMSRLLATCLVTVSIVLGLIMSIVVLLPSLIEQVITLIKQGPLFLETAKAAITKYVPSFAHYADVISQSLLRFAAVFQSGGAAVALSFLSSALSAISAISFIVILPVVVFYLLLDWKNMLTHIDALIPRPYLEVSRRLAREVDQTLANFVRGALGVSLLLGAFYTVALKMVGLDYALTVGIIAGALTFVPYVGAIIGGTLAIGIALFQFWGDWVTVGMVAVIFVSGQFIEGNVITPRLVGHAVRLNPIWILFALSCFGALLGFTGLLLAVPLAAVFGVFLRFGSERYKESAAYKGHNAASSRLREETAPLPKDSSSA